MVSDRNAIIGGCAAGFVVDIALFPIDTIKTRMQSMQGLRLLGLSDLHKLKGVGAAAVGSMPGSALFFLTYEHVKRRNQGGGIKQHMLASSLGEIMACLVRVPTEVVKQRVQAKLARSSWEGLKHTLANTGLRGLYVGYGTTVMREIPFAAIQYPIWEKLRSAYNPEGSGFKSGVCGSVAGAIAGGLTTPIDVVKTRLMLSTNNEGLVQVVRELYKEGLSSFYKGFSARIGWLSIGGFVYLGTYQTVIEHIV
ncbi:hypothetical protein ACHWQZ_G014156 [Mnemiopsis leidyi]